MVGSPAQSGAAGVFQFSAKSRSLKVAPSVALMNTKLTGLISLALYGSRTVLLRLSVITQRESQMIVPSLLWEISIPYRQLPAGIFAPDSAEPSFRNSGKRISDSRSANAVARTNPTLIFTTFLRGFFRFPDLEYRFFPLPVGVFRVGGIFIRFNNANLIYFSLYLSNALMGAVSMSS